MNILKELETKNLTAAIALEVYAHRKWTVWTQDGPSDDTMLVCEELNVGIAKDSILGFSFFPLPLDHLESCGWVCVGEL